MQQMKTALKMLFVMIALTGLIYPLLVTLIAQLAMPKQANGSLLLNGDRVVGSELIAQRFQQPLYFWPRPSAIDYDPLHPSGGSNLGPTSQKLRDEVRERAQQLSFSSEHEESIPAELVYTSGSGLDPHISLEAAYFQMPRIAQARGLNIENQKRLESLIERLAEGQQLHFLGSSYVNVLLLNQALDQEFGVRSP